MLPISVKLLRRLYLYFEEIFCSVFTTLCGLLVSQIFVWGLRIRLPLPPPPPLSLLRRLCLILLEICPENLTAKTARIFTLAQNARSHASGQRKGLDWG